jgi:anti-sigma regulatory factor (Ser/Thr protein kinase)
MQSLLVTASTCKETHVSTHVSRSPASQTYLSPTELLGSLVLNNSSASAALARQFARVALTAGGYDDHTDTFELLVSELVTNAVVHAQDPFASSVHVRVVTRGSVVRLEVHDSELRLPTPRSPSLDEESGRGLFIVQTLATNWGTSCTSTDKCVWCEVDTKG